MLSETARKAEAAAAESRATTVFKIEYGGAFSRFRAIVEERLSLAKEMKELNARLDGDPELRGYVEVSAHRGKRARNRVQH